jgi:hypothetical protein
VVLRQPLKPGVSVRNAKITDGGYRYAPSDALVAHCSLLIAHLGKKSDLKINLQTKYRTTIIKTNNNTPLKNAQVLCIFRVWGVAAGSEGRLTMMFGRGGGVPEAPGSGFPRRPVAIGVFPPAPSGGLYPKAGLA